MDKKTSRQNWKYISILALFAGVIFVFILYLLDAFTGIKTRPFYQLIIEGIIFAVVYGFLFYLLTEKLIPLLVRSVKPNLMGDEKLKMDGPASLLNGFEKVGGKLFLTDLRLIFKPHKLNIHRKQINVELEQISDVMQRKISTAPDNGIRVTTADGKDFDFVVHERDLWLKNLPGKKAKA
jgi:hypothetical protein